MRGIIDGYRLSNAEYMRDQLALGVRLKDHATLSSYFQGSNGQAWAQVKAMASGCSDNFLYLWGEKDTGVTHLLQGACQHAQLTGRTAVYCPLSSLRHESPMSLKGLDMLQLVCLDDIQMIAGRADWEEAVFHLFNACRDNGQTKLIIAAGSPAKQTGVKLPDLVSRLSWGVSYQLNALSDSEIIQALQMRAQVRGLMLPDEVAQYLLKRCPRTMSTLYAHLDTLDRASLAAQRKITIPFVKSVLNL